MTRLRVPTYSTRPISWRQTHGSVEASDLTGFGQSGPFVSRVWDDSADVGLVLRSHRTGREVLFGLVDVDRGSDGEVRSWKLESHPGGNLHLTVFND